MPCFQHEERENVVEGSAIDNWVQFCGYRFCSTLSTAARYQAALLWSLVLQDFEHGRYVFGACVGGDGVGR